MSIAMLSSSQRRFPLLLAASAASGFIGGLLGALIAVQLLWPRRLDDKLEGEEDAAERNRLSGGAILSPTAVAREALPGRIILLRHGESEGNADKTLYRTKPDNLIELTAAGSAQAREAGARILDIVGDKTVDLYVSPFQRTIQTARNVRAAFQEAGREHQLRHTSIDPRVREQEFGNLQLGEFESYRAEQQRVGRFWYRFPTGESGADVFDRTKQWWDSAVMQHNMRPGFDRVDTVVVVTHGLTMRFILMQLFGWSPHTFSTVWNADNCDMYVLKYDPKLRGRSPYRLCDKEGNRVRSTAHLDVKVRGHTTPQSVDMEDYLAVPPPRTSQVSIIKRKLLEQAAKDPNHTLHGITDPEVLESIDFFKGAFRKYK